MRRLVCGFTLVLGGFVLFPMVAHADGWDGSKVTVRNWTRTAAVTVHANATFAMTATSGHSINSSPAFMTNIWYDFSADSSWSPPTWSDPAWRTDGQFSFDSDTYVGTMVASRGVTLSSGDGKKTVYGAFEVRCTNWAANQLISDVYSDKTTLDTHGPKTYAPSVATCAQRGTGYLKYKVTDNLSPKATVTIVIRKGTKTVRTLTCGLKTVGTSHSRAFTCNLAKGQYKFTVKAKDLAGSPQSTAGSNYLTVH